MRKRRCRVHPCGCNGQSFCTKLDHWTYRRKIYKTINKNISDAGADGITFHVEAAENPGLVIDLIRSANKQIGISLKPQTPFSMIEPFLDQIDLLLIMSVEPGFGGQEYIPGSTKRIEGIHQRLIALGLRDRILIEIDGGIKLTNAEEIAKAGAEILVAGSEIFQSENPVQTIQKFKALGVT